MLKHNWIKRELWFWKEVVIAQVLVAAKPALNSDCLRVSCHNAEPLYAQSVVRGNLMTLNSWGKCNKNHWKSLTTDKFLKKWTKKSTKHCLIPKICKSIMKDWTLTNICSNVKLPLWVPMKWNKFQTCFDTTKYLYNLLIWLASSGVHFMSKW